MLILTLENFWEESCAVGQISLTFLSETSEQSDLAVLSPLCMEWPLYSIHKFLVCSYLAPGSQFSFLPFRING